MNETHNHNLWPVLCKVVGAPTEIGKPEDIRYTIAIPGGLYEHDVEPSRRVVQNGFEIKPALVGSPAFLSEGRFYVWETIVIADCEDPDDPPPPPPPDGDDPEQPQNPGEPSPPGEPME